MGGVAGEWNCPMQMLWITMKTNFNGHSFQSAFEWSPLLNLLWPVTGLLLNQTTRQRSSKDSPCCLLKKSSLTQRELRITAQTKQPRAKIHLFNLRKGSREWLLVDGGLQALHIWENGLVYTLLLLKKFRYNSKVKSEACWRKCWWHKVFNFPSWVFTLQLQS